MAARTDELIDLTDDERLERRPERDDDRGRDAEAPRDIPAPGWKDVAVRVKGELKDDQVPLLSAGVAFFLLLAMFPALAALVTVYGLVADPDQVSQQVTDLTGTLPQDAQGLITDQLENITSQQQGLGLTLAVSVLGALWAASSGVKHLIGSINAAYDEQRPGSSSSCGAWPWP